MKITVEATGIENIDMLFERFPQVAAKAMSMAINDTARGPAIDLAKDEMYKQVAFPAGYLDDPNRLGVTQFAYPERLEAVITGRDRPTSLARFTPDRPGNGQTIVRTKTAGRASGNATPRNVVVKPGDPRPLFNTFFVGLGQGQMNVGLAIRLRPGESITNINAYKPTRFDKQTPEQAAKNGEVWLLYGPSVDQVFRGVADEIAPAVAEALDKEFTRQFAVQMGQV